jgi:membrane-associated protease RseP (regulator of RpoE activity)
VTDEDPRPPSKAAQALLVGGAPKPEGELASSPWRLAFIAGFVGLIGLFYGWGWMVIIGALSLMIFLHEVGHFVTAKWAGMKVTEFCILGVGPKLWSVRRGETEYMVRLIPIAAYVRIIGMNNLDDTDPADEPRTFRQQSFPKRVVVMSGGSAMHFLQALVLFFVVFAFVGVPGDSGLAQRLGGAAPSWGIVEVIDGGAAKAAGLQPGDELVSIAGHPIDDPDDIKRLVVPRAGDTVDIVVDRSGAQRTLDVTIGRNPEARSEGFLGIRSGELDADLLPEVKAGAVDAVLESGRATGDIAWEHVKALGDFATGGLGDFADRLFDGGEEEGGGPVVSSGGEPSGSDQSVEDEARPISIFGVARIGADAAENNLAEVLILMAVVNVSIGLINLMPLLPLDGGHIAIAVYERVRSRKGRRHMADVSRLLPLTYAVVLLLGLLMMSSLYLDIVDPIGVG